MATWQHDGGVGSGAVHATTAQLELVLAAAATTKSLDPLLCFDLLNKLLVAIDNDPRELLCMAQRKCEDVLQALLLLGCRPPIRRLISMAIVKLIEKGDGISVYSRVSSLQGWFSDKADKKIDSSCYQGVTLCLGALTKSFGQKLSSSLAETASIVAKLMRHSEVCVRQAAMQLLQNAVEGTQGGGSANSYAEVVRVITRLGSTDRSPLVRARAAGCLRVLANVGGPGLAGPGMDLCTALCIKAMEDLAQSVRDEFAAALGALLALGLHPNKQVQPRGKGPAVAPKVMDGAVQKYLIAPFTRAVGPKARDLRMGIAMAWVAFLQALRLNYGMSDLDLPAYGMQALSMLAASAKTVVDGHAQACVLYVLRVGVVEQMSESAEREFSSLLVKELSVVDNSTSMLIVTLRTLTHLLKTLGEVTAEAKVAFDEALTKVLCHPSDMVRVEAALTVRALAVADPTSVHGLMSCGLTALRALRDSVSVEKGDKLKSELDSLHGHAATLSALLTAAPRLPLGVPSRLPMAILDVARQMVLQPDTKKAQATAVEKEAGWMLVGALVSSMAKEELKEHQFDLLALWAVPFGGNCMERLKRTSTNLQSELTCWSMAMEALTAFIKSHVVPSLSPELESVLLNPVLGYLSGALVYVSSPTLQEAPASLRPAVELLTIRTLDAFRSLPDPVLYKNDHHSLLALCMSPFRVHDGAGKGQWFRRSTDSGRAFQAALILSVDASTVPASTCLRHLLDVRDASLGPWVPGRDSLEDELRAFEGGSDALLPCIWDNETPFFPQALPQLISLVNSMLLCFGIVFAAQTEKNKLHLLDLMLSCMKLGRKQSWRSANATNVCVSLLGGLKACVAMKTSSEPEAELWKRIQELVQSVLLVDGTSPANRRAAAEILGLLARLGGDAFALRLAKSLLNEAATSTDPAQKCAIALSLGCVHRSVGGMALSALVPAVVQGLCTLAKDATDDLYIWALHSLWLTADAAGLSFMPHVEATLSLCLEMLLSEDHSTPQLWQCVGRLVNAMIAVLGPELVPGTPVFSRCKSIVAEISTAVEPAAQLECVLYAQQLVLFAPQAVPARDIVQTLRATLTSRQPSLRQAAVATLQHMSERDPSGVVPERVEEDLLAMLDNETDLRIIRNVCLTLERLQEVACPTCPSRWLRLCRNVVLAASSTRTAAGDAFHMSSGPSSPTTASAPGPSWQSAELNDSGEGDDEDSVVSIGDRGGRVVSAVGSGASTSMGKFGDGKLVDADQLPRYRTRVFAAKCLSRLPLAVGSNPAHFDLQRAREERQTAASKGEPVGDWLVCLLGELVALAYQVATGTMENVRPLGIGLLRTLLQKFGSTEDPDYEGHLLLEQYQAQLVSAVRAAFEPGAGPLLMAAGAELAAKLITCGLTGGDRGVIQRVMALLSVPLTKWDDLSHPSFAEWVGCRVRVGILAAHAAVKSYTVAECKRNKTSPKGVLQVWANVHFTEDTAILKPHLCKQLPLLSQFWIGLLRDYAVARSQIPAVQSAYKPFLQASKSPAVMAVVRTFLDEAWPSILEAVTSDAVPALRIGGSSNGNVKPVGGERADAKKNASFCHKLEDDLKTLSGGEEMMKGGPVDAEGGTPVERRPSTVGFVKSIASTNGLTTNSREYIICHAHECCVVLEADDFIVLWTLALMVLCQGGTSADSEHVLKASSRPGLGTGWMMHMGGSGGAGVGTGLGLSHRLDVVGAQLASLAALRHLTGREFCLADYFSTELCRELLQVLVDVDVEKSPQVQLAIAELFEKLMTGLPEEYLADEIVMNNGAELGVSCMHRLIAVEVLMTRGKAPEIERALACVMNALTKYASRITPQVQVILIPQLLCAGLRALRTLVPTANSLMTAASFMTSLANIAGDPTDIWSKQRGRMLAGVVESLAVTNDKILGKSEVDLVVVETEGDSELVNRLPVLLTIMSHFTQCIQSEKLEAPPTLRELSRSRFMTTMHSVLTSKYHQAQFAGIHTLRTILQSASIEKPRAEAYVWGLECMRELGTDAAAIVHNATQMPLTSAAATAIGEALKLFVLLHSLLDDPVGQLQVLHVLLPTIIVAAGPHLNGSAGPASAGLTAMAVKLITHFASNATSALQFKDVLSSLPEGSLQQLQAAVRASMGSSLDSPSTLGSSIPPNNNAWGLGSPLSITVPASVQRPSIVGGGGVTSFPPNSGSIAVPASVQRPSIVGGGGGGGGGVTSFPPISGVVLSHHVRVSSISSTSSSGLQMQAQGVEMKTPVDAAADDREDDEDWGDFASPVQSPPLHQMEDLRSERLDWNRSVTFQHGPVVVASGPVTFQHGPVVTASAPVTFQHGPVVAASGPVTFQHGPVVMASAPVTFQHGPVVAASRPVTFQHGPVIAAPERVPEMSANDLDDGNNSDGWGEFRAVSIEQTDGSVSLSKTTAEDGDEWGSFSYSVSVAGASFGDTNDRNSVSMSLEESHRNEVSTDRGSRTVTFEEDDDDAWGDFTTVQTPSYVPSRGATSYVTSDSRPHSAAYSDEMMSIPASCGHGNDSDDEWADFQEAVSTTSSAPLSPVKPVSEGDSQTAQGSPLSQQAKGMMDGSEEPDYATPASPSSPRSSRTEVSDGLLSPSKQGMASPASDAEVEKGDADKEKGDAGEEKGDVDKRKGDADVEEGDADELQESTNVVKRFLCGSEDDKDATSSGSGPASASALTDEMCTVSFSKFEDDGHGEQGAVIDDVASGNVAGYEDTPSAAATLVLADKSGGVSSRNIRGDGECKDRASSSIADQDVRVLNVEEESMHQDEDTVSDTACASDTESSVAKEEKPKPEKKSVVVEERQSEESKEQREETEALQDKESAAEDKDEEQEEPEQEELVGNTENGYSRSVDVY